MILNKIIEKIREAKNIAILPHVSADGDAIGSSLALALAIGMLQKQAAVFLEEDMPLLFDFLPGQDLARVYRKEEVTGFDLVIALDTGDLERLGSRIDIFSMVENTVNIDHHPTNTMFAPLNYVQAGAAAVGEIIYEMVKLMDLTLNTEISTCLYVALVTDTGGFRYSNTTSLTHQIAAELINHGVNASNVSQQIFENTSFERLKLMSLVLNKLELLEDGKVSFIEITGEMLQEAGAAEDDCDGMVNLGRSIRGVEIAVVLREKSKDEVRVNLRSKVYADVSAVAASLGGGGHKKAAGCTFKGSIVDAKRAVMEKIRKVLAK